MCRIKEGERCMACHLELRTQGVSATRAQPAKIKVNMDSGVLLLLCEEHFRAYCRVVTDEDRQGLMLLLH
jgi:hypothetical protein